MNIDPEKNNDGIVIRCMIQYLLSCKISMKGRSPVLIIIFIGERSGLNLEYMTPSEAYSIGYL